MKVKTLIIVGAIVLIALAFSGLRQNEIQAIEPSGAPAAIQMIESGEAETLLVQGELHGAPYYRDQLKSLARNYRKAQNDGERANLVSRAEELLNQMFDERVKAEHHKIQMLENRIQTMKDRLQSMELHRSDLIHESAQKCLQNGKLPDWAKSSNDAAN